MTEAHRYFGMTAAEWIKKAEAARDAINALDEEYQALVHDPVPSTLINRLLGRDRNTGISTVDAKILAKRDIRRVELIGDQAFFREMAKLYLQAETAEHIRFIAEQVEYIASRL